MKNSKNQIKALIFDVGGVLELGKSPKWKKGCHRNKGVHMFMAKELGISLDQWFDSIDTTYSDSITGEISEKQSLRIISENLKISEGKLKKLLIRAYKKNFQTNKKLYNFAFKLRKNGYKIAILSDQWYPSKNALIPKKIQKKFDASVISCDTYGLRKPNPRIYKLILKKLKLPAKNCIFIDNQQWNINPAKSLGFRTILYKNNKQLFRQFEKILT
jgi:epoxide hydrolase-like predicted phosphatase